MAPKHFPSLAAAAFAAMLFHFFLKRRSREINRRKTNNDAAANEGTSGGASGAHTPTGVAEMATSSGPAQDAAGNNGTAGGASGAHTPTGLPEMATSSGPAKDAAANDGRAGGDSGANTSTGVPEMSTSTGCDYEVFLSFRGPDTREAFTDYLYTSLKDAGIRVFKDDEDLRVGEEFAIELLRAIKQSKILVPIFSKNYASSVWCLKEVVQMIECKKTGGQKIMPIFYDVAPAEVRHQTGGYGDAFLSHEQKNRYDEETMCAWKAALKEVSFLNGWDLQSMPNRREGAFTKQLTEEVFRELKKAYLVVSNCLVSVDNHVDAIMGMISAQTNETRILGIHGMGGIGKTTTAKIIYNRLSENFDGCCFLSNIREMSERKGIECLQNQLISDILKKKCPDVTSIDDGIKTIKERLSDKRVLLLLDDVHEKKHMDALVGERDWFGKGSKLIITTRNKEALDALGVDEYYELMSMDRDQSLQLFSKHAFRRDSPLDEYIVLSNRAIDIAGGLPLALEIIGSLLSPIEKENWDLKLKKLENVPHMEVQSKLKISYDALEVRQQHIFLDIACLFIGYDKDIMVHFWDESKFPEEGLEVLQNMSLIKIIKDNEVWMHDQLRDLGREIVRRESQMKIEKQSRVWDPKEGLDLLRKHKGQKEVQALHLDLKHQPQCRFTYEGFESLSDLRFLEVIGSMENFHAEERRLWHESPSNVLPTNENPDLLPHLRWLSWSHFPPTLNIANFLSEDVVILNLSQSKIADDWKGWSHIKVMKNLKVLKLFGAEIHLLSRLPESLVILSLKSLKMDTFPDLSNLTNLRKLEMRFCSRDSSGESDGLVDYPIPQWFGNLSKLECLHLYCPFVTGLSLPPQLKELKLDCPNLSSLVLSNCQSLESLELSSPYVTTSPTDLALPPPRLPRLSSLKLEYCPSLCSVGDLSNLKSLRHLQLYCLPRLKLLPDLSNLNELRSLHIYKCDGLVEIQGELPRFFEELDISFCYSLRKLPDLSSLNRLRSVRIQICSHLDVEPISSLCLEKSIEFVGNEVWYDEEDEWYQRELMDRGFFF